MRSFLCQLWTLDSFIWTLSISSAATKCQQREMAPRGVSDQIGFSFDWRGMKYLNKGEKAREDFLFRCYNLSPGIGWEGWSGLRPAGGSCNAMPSFCRRQSNKQIEKSNWLMLISKTYRWTELYQGTRDEKGKVNLSRISCCVFFLAYFAMSPN